MLDPLFNKGYSAAAVAAMTSVVASASASATLAATISGSNHGKKNGDSTLLSTIDDHFVPRNLRHFRGSAGVTAAATTTTS